MNVEIIKGLSGGCNEEAILLIKNLQFGWFRNRGFRLKTKKQFRIKFQVPPDNVVICNLETLNEEKSERDTLKIYTHNLNQIKRKI